MDRFGATRIWFWVRFRTGIGSTQTGLPAYGGMLEKSELIRIHGIDGLRSLILEDGSGAANLQKDAYAAQRINWKSSGLI